MKRLIISGSGFCAVTEDGILVEYFPAEQADECGNILLGRVDRMMPGMKCAFVDIGRKRNGFLPLDEESATFTGKPVHSGDKMIMQIKKEETGEKGVFLTRDISLPGRFVILMPMNRYIGVSGRVRNEETRRALKNIGEEIANGKYGLILRNAASETDEEEIRAEAGRLFGEWLIIRNKALEGGSPGRILRSFDPASQLREDYTAGGYEEVKETKGPDAEILAQLKLAAEKKLRLPGGGNIVIDRCEAMTVIDVNSASSGTGGTKDKNILQTNLEACKLIADQVRLRNLAGIIMIDFIDMKEETDQSLVEEQLKNCFACDRVKTVIHGWTRLGIMEMTRKRNRQELVIDGENPYGE